MMSLAILSLIFQAFDKEAYSSHFLQCIQMILISSIP